MNFKVFLFPLDRKEKNEKKKNNFEWRNNKKATNEYTMSVAVLFLLSSSAYFNLLFQEFRRKISFYFSFVEEFKKATKWNFFAVSFRRREKLRKFNYLMKLFR